VTHFVSSWTGMTHQHKFEDRFCILLKRKILNYWKHSSFCDLIDTYIVIREEMILCKLALQKISFFLPSSA
jgi:hypothetical protein